MPLPNAGTGRDDDRHVQPDGRAYTNADIAYQNARLAYRNAGLAAAPYASPASVPQRRTSCVCARVLRSARALRVRAPVTRVLAPLRDARGNRCTGPVDAVPGRVARSPLLVGRAAELATARGLVDAVTAGRGGALLVAGEAGIGKTRLLDEVAGRAARARAAGAVRASGAGRRDVPGGRRRGDRPPRRPGPRPGPGAAPLPRRAGPAAAQLGRARRRDATARASADPVVVLAEGLLRLLRLALGTHPAACCAWRTCTGPTTTPSPWSSTSRAPPPTPPSCWPAPPATTPRPTPPDAWPPRPGRSPCTSPGSAAGTWRRWPRRAGAAGPSPTRRRSSCCSAPTGCRSRSRSCSPRPAPRSRRRSPRSSPAGSRRYPRRRPGDPARRGRAGPGARLAAPRPGRPRPRSRTCSRALRAAVGQALLVADGPALRWPHALTRDAVLAVLLPPERAALAGRVARVLADRAGPDDEPRAAELFVEAGETDAAVTLLLRLARRDAARGALRSAEHLLADRGRGRSGTPARRCGRRRAGHGADPRRPGRRRAGPRRRRARRAARRCPRRAVPAARPHRDHGRGVGRRGGLRGARRAARRPALARPARRRRVRRRPGGRRGQVRGGGDRPGRAGPRRARGGHRPAGRRAGGGRALRGARGRRAGWPGAPTSTSPRLSPGGPRRSPASTAWCPGASRRCSSSG